MSSSAGLSKGLRIVSAKMDRTAGTSLLNTLDWYMMVSRDDEHMTLPPSASISDVICCEDRLLVDLKAMRSRRWDEPDSPGTQGRSYRDPASI